MTEPPPAARSRPPPRRTLVLGLSLVLVAILSGSALFTSGFLLGRDEGRSPGSSPSEAAAWQPFWDVYDAITTRYPPAKIDRTTLIEGAIRGMVEAVGDPYSTYLSRTDYVGIAERHLGPVHGHRRRDRGRR